MSGAIQEDNPANLDVAYKAFNDSVAALTSHDVPLAVTKLLTRLKSTVHGVETKLRAAETAQRDQKRMYCVKLSEVENKLRNVSSELGMKFPSPAEEAALANGTDKVVSKETLAAEPVANGAPAKAKEDRDTREKVFVFLGQKQPLCMSYEFPFCIGDFYFDSFYQALNFIKFKYLGHNALAWKVKVTTSVTAIDGFGSSLPESDQEKWAEVRDQVGMILMREKAEQAPEFREILVNSRDDAEFFQCGENQYCTVGVGWAVAVGQTKNGTEKAQFPGQNKIGDWLVRLRDEIRNQVVSGDDFDFGSHCRFTTAHVKEGGKILAIADSKLLEGMRGRGRTAFHGFPNVDILSDGPESLFSTLFSKDGDANTLLARDFAEARTVILHLGTAFLQKDENEFEARLQNLIECLRAATDVPIFVVNLPPRPDSLGDHVKLINFAIRVTVRTCGKENVYLLDLYDRFVDAKGKWRRLYLQLGDITFNTRGCGKFVELLAELCPVANFVVDARSIAVLEKSVDGSDDSLRRLEEYSRKRNLIFKHFPLDDAKDNFNGLATKFVAVVQDRGVCPRSFPLAKSAISAIHRMKGGALLVQFKSLEDAQRIHRNKRKFNSGGNSGPNKIQCSRDFVGERRYSVGYLTKARAEILKNADALGISDKKSIKLDLSSTNPRLVISAQEFYYAHDMPAKFTSIPGIGKYRPPASSAFRQLVKSISNSNIVAGGASTSGASGTQIDYDRAIPVVTGN